MRVPNRFWWDTGVDFFSFDVIFELWAENRAGSGKLSGNYSYEWERDFVFWWGWDAGFEGKRKRVTGFQFLPDLINCYWPALQTFCAYSCVRFQVINSNGQCPVILHYHLITLVSWDYMKSFSTILIICVSLRQWHLSITDASVSNLGIPILSSFSSVSTFSRALGFDCHTVWRW